MKKIRKYNNDDTPPIAGKWERYLKTLSIIITKVFFLILGLVPAMGLAITHYRLPFSFDFDIGDGELMVNPKYSSPDWDRYMQGLDIEVLDTVNGNSRAMYRNPWW